MKLQQCLPVLMLICCLICVPLRADESDISTRLVERAKSISDAGNYAKAEQYYAEATKADASNVLAWTGLASCQKRLGQFNDAKRSVVILIGLARDSSDCQLLGSQICEEAGDYTDGLTYVKAAINLNPNSAQLYDELGLLQLMSGDKNGVAETLIRLDALEPGAHESGYYHHIAWLLAFTSQPFRPCHLADDEHSDPSLAQFLIKLRSAVRTRDANYLLSIVSDEVSVGGGDYNGSKGFNENFHPHKRNSEIWSTLDRILSLHGGWMQDEYGSYGKRRRRRGFEMPTIKLSKPYKSALEEPYGYIIRDGVQLKASPSTSSSTTATVEMQAIVAHDGSISVQDIKSWTKILTADGKSGYVSDDDIYWDSDDYVTFARVSGKWMMVHFEPHIDY